jgi:hypothetical protein
VVDNPPPKARQPKLLDNFGARYHEGEDDQPLRAGSFMMGDKKTHDFAEQTEKEATELQGVIADTNPLTAGIQTGSRVALGYDPVRDQNVSTGARWTEGILTGAGAVASVMDGLLPRLRSLFSAAETGEGIGGAAASKAEGAVAGAAPKTFSPQAVQRAGKEGEEAAGILKNTQRIESLTGTAKYRVPDELTKVGLREIKNVLKLSNTKQLQDYLLYARKTGRKFILETRPNTIISGPLQKLINAGSFEHRIIGQ